MLNDLEALPAQLDVILSLEQPEGYDGEWWPLHPNTHSLIL